jgi:hypothetical protein
MAFLRRYPYLLILAATACNIIGDGDIKNLDGISDLKLASYQVAQRTTRGSGVQNITLLYDSATNIGVSNGQFVTRIVWYETPGGGSLKLRYKSGATANLRTYTSYLSGGQPYTYALYQGDSAVELYRFRYDASGRLNRIITDINPVDDLPVLLRTNDTIIYQSSNQILSIERRSFDEARRGTFEIQYQQDFNGTSVSRVSFQNISVASSFANCPQGNGGDGCAGYSYEQLNPPNTFSTIITNMRVNRAYTFSKLSQLELIDVKFNSNGGGGGSCCYDYDTYYFHPTMVLQGELLNGADLMAIYMIDWWQPGDPLTGNANYSSNDEVQINFNYEL